MSSPTSKAAWIDLSMSSTECEKACLRNCSCTAYIRRDIDGKRIGCWAYYVKRKLHNQSFNLTSTKGSLDGDELKYSSRHPDLVVFDLSSMVAATENFSLGNKLGQGGFGYGQLSNGQEIAVKRLSKCSLQGIEEFKNEVMLIAKLQHRNLVKVLGCCIQGEEKMLIYEYMQNRSLDFFMFDHTRRSSLNSVQCFVIILGIARGILYLHQESRLRIIYRDLKKSNVLLDAEMNPKISDFGMARLFKGDQIQDRTTRVVWELCTEDRAFEIVDPSVKESYVSDGVLRCIHIALLCVEEDAGDRPTMMAVLLMLSSEATALPSPKQPAFIFGRPLNAVAYLGYKMRGVEYLRQNY
ncbi:hypothetical protein CJ030_MR2G029010 [Morella rubra]|uniref:non-specific serine/threonine protein kinase n=1 Tax=Morella rubra TaxID=262757 RepID=A0A6A1WBX9_9ROSI|nr:hypothetical protein CJ030_MR2G029010 [Morella rubra]